MKKVFFILILCSVLGACSSDDEYISTKKSDKLCLNIQTYDGGNEALHPKVLYFKNGWKGWSYWLVCTPYKGMNDAIENPCIYVSQNGINWIVPDGLTNPIDDISNVRIEYNSDPHLVYRPDLDRLECWWRWVGRGNHPTKPFTEIIYRRISKDGIVWSDRELCFEYANTVNTTRAVISPSVIFENNKYKMWASHCTVNQNIRRIGYWESSDGVNWTEIREIDLGHVIPSHIDVIKYNGSFHMVVFDVSQPGFPYYYSHSNNNVVWSKPVKILEKSNTSTWDNGRLYRPSLTIVGSSIRLYYSAYSDNGTNHIGLIIFDNFNAMMLN